MIEKIIYCPQWVLCPCNIIEQADSICARRRQKTAKRANRCLGAGVKSNLNLLHAPNHTYSAHSRKAWHLVIGLYVWYMVAICHMDAANKEWYLYGGCQKTQCFIHHIDLLAGRLLAIFHHLDSTPLYGAGQKKSLDAPAEWESARVCALFTDKFPSHVLDVRFLLCRQSLVSDRSLQVQKQPLHSEEMALWWHKRLREQWGWG